MENHKFRLCFQKYHYGIKVPKSNLLVIFMVTDRCAVGEEPNAANTGCMPCSLGYYQDVAESVSCKMCPADYSTRNTGSNSSAACESKR